MLLVFVDPRTVQMHSGSYSEPRDTKDKNQKVVEVRTTKKHHYVFKNLVFLVLVPLTSLTQRIEKLRQVISGFVALIVLLVLFYVAINIAFVADILVLGLLAGGIFAFFGFFVPIFFDLSTEEEALSSFTMPLIFTHLLLVVLFAFLLIRPQIVEDPGRHFSFKFETYEEDRFARHFHYKNLNNGWQEIRSLVAYDLGLWPGERRNSNLNERQRLLDDHLF